ncbi:site-specific integrase [Ruminococcus bicirculans (ex Wegman et al. 2014)]|uniref:site-specific integrase n=1 Tax=Ruminococcus bicirculans (ex Wegman et al. 2014) TaxID=1160721 RepID=UPI003FD81A68
MNYRNVYLRKDGRYEGRVFLDTSGSKRKYHAFFGKTHDEVIAKMKKYHIDLISKTQIRKTFTEVYEEWFGTVTIRIKESTAANYILKADKHILPFFGQKCICKITNDDIYDFIRRKQQENLSNRYITDILVLMKSIFKYAYKTYKIDNIMDGIVMPKKPRVEIRILNDDEDKKLCDILAQKNDLTSIGIYLSRVTGLRIGELCALKWENIDIEQGIISVNKTLQRIQVKNGLCKTKLMLAEPKSESSKRKIPIPKCVLELLKNNRGDNDNYILSNKKKPIEPRTIQYRFAKILKNGNLPSVHFHAIRHFFATNCIKLGFDVKALSEILGHSNVSITLDRYVHSSFEQKAEYMNRIR